VVPPRVAPGRDCPRCPRLVAYRQRLRRALPGGHNAPVASFGDPAAALLIVGLAPGAQGANRTGRPFTGDAAGELLYAALARHGFSHGRYGARPDDGLELVGCRITNALRCVPPQNRPIGAEVAACRAFLRSELTDGAPPRVALALGRVAWDAVLRALGVAAGRFAFAHGAVATVPGQPTLVGSYHCSRYNVNTGRLTPAMFETAFARAAALARAATA
jgi:uracil-DNA glycosylase family 4